MRPSVAVGLLLAGAALAKLFDATTSAAHAEAGSPNHDQSVVMHVINSTKTNDTLAFVYDTKTQRLAMYAVAGDRNKELALCSVRNTAYDVRIHELNNYNAPGTSLKDLKKTFDDEEAKRREKEAKEAKDAKDAKDKEAKDAKG